MKLLLLRRAFLFCLLLCSQWSLSGQECLDQRVDSNEDEVEFSPFFYSFQSSVDGSLLLATNARQDDNSRLVHLYDRDLNILRDWRYALERDGEIADIQARESGGYLGVINTPSFQNRFSTYSIFLIEDASTPEENIIYTSDFRDAPMKVENILSVQDSVLFLSGVYHGEWAVTPDSTFIEKQVNNQTVWRHINRGGVLLGLDGDADKINLLVARDNDIEVITMSGETGEVESSYFISLTGHRFAPLIFRDVEKNITYLAKFTDTYELSRHSSAGTDWTYHKVQTLTSDWIDRIRDIQYDEDGFIYVNGIFYNEENSSGILLTKLSPEGDLIWEKRYDTEGELSASSSFSTIEDRVIYLSARKTTQAGAWNQHVLAFSLDDGRLLKECSVIESDNHRFSSAGIKLYEGIVYTFGSFNDRVDPVLSVRSFDFSDLTSSNAGASPAAQMNIKVYPNPTDRGGQVSVEIPLPHKLSRIQVMSVEGREVVSFGLSANQSQLQIEELPAGTYVLYARDQGGVVVAERRVVVR
ncbi:T9SS type A sorting domain-containing protein [Neolewinella agarilytica]|uniref:T9SS type A sorting domain-containing protein n=1 Tax=Neolewinella agarilytica TaxID=478744 RepID=UPI0023550238|nr:T9SS type A sorting domain-containing protein [Neolewinella agarilytica]